MTANNEVTWISSARAVPSAAVHSADTSSEKLAAEYIWNASLGMRARRPNSQFALSEIARLVHLMRDAISSRDEAVFSCQTASVTAGTYSDCEGLRKYRLKDEHGTEDEFERPLPKRACDLQSDVGAVKHSEPPAPATDDQTPASQCAADSTLSSEDRLEALRDWIASDPDPASQFVAAELHRNDLQVDWSRIVIYAAEAVRFQDLQVRDQVASDLLQHALKLRSSSSSKDAPVVLCAIRRAGSIISGHRVLEFLPLLNAGSPIDTRLVTLQAITAVFSCSPPSSFAVLEKLAKRVVTLAKKHWDTDVFKAGEVSAIAIEATIAATVLGAPEVTDLGPLALGTGRQLLVGKLRTRLKHVMQNWHSISPKSREVEFVEMMVSRLNSAG